MAYGEEVITRALILSIFGYFFLPFLIAACDAAPPESVQKTEIKSKPPRWGGIPVDEGKLPQKESILEPLPDVPAMERLAEAGDAEVQFHLGTIYRTGSYVTADTAKAVAWFEKAAAQGHVKAQFILGTMHYEGEGIPQDHVIAAEWFEKAAAQGYAGAQFMLGTIYDRGEGVPKNKSKAVGWWEKVAEQEGNAAMQYLVGMMYSFGDGMPEDYKKSAAWIEKAAEQGHADAQGRLAILYISGEGVKKDAVKAAEWCQKAAAQGNVRSQYNLGIMYSKGEGLPKNVAKAVEWYQKAAAQGHADAQDKLWAAYILGEGVPRDNILAYAWANLAAAQGYEDAKKHRDVTELSSDQRAEAERMSSNWKLGQVLRREAAGGNAVAAPDEPSPAAAMKKVSTGTLFVVSAHGQSITNAHVVNDCTELHIENRDGIATVTTMDVINDLALIQIPGTAPVAAPISKEPGKIRQGEEIVVFGFPLNTVLSSGGNLTPGVVSAMTGLGNNSNQIQITASIQPGSSGSPVLNKKGEVVGVVSSKLSDAKMADATGSVGQNVNFAINGQTLKAFLDANEVSYKDGAGYFTLEKQSAELADEARKWTLVVECWK